MNGLLPHQRLLLKDLASSDREGLVVVQAPVGAGAGMALAAHVAEASRTGWVVVATTTQASLWQWRERLADGGTTSVELTNDVALEWSDQEGARPRSGVLLATYARLNRPRSKHALADLGISVLLLDNPALSSGVTADTLLHLTTISARTVAVTALTPEALPVWLQTAHWISVDLGLMRASYGSRRPDVRVRHITANADADILLEEARQALGWTPRQMRAASRAAVHEALLTLAAREELNPTPNSEGLARTWQLLDEIEGLGEDPQLEAVLQAVHHLQMQGLRVWVIVSRILAEADYINGYLASAGVRTTLATSHSHPSAFHLLRQEGSGDRRVIVATMAGLEQISTQDRGVALVLLSLPTGLGDRAMLRSLLVTGSIASLTLVVADEVPPSDIEDFVRI